MCVARVRARSSRDIPALRPSRISRMDTASAVVTRRGGYLGYAPIDCDVHCAVSDTTALLPYFDEYWRNAIVERGIDRLSLNLTSYPPNAPISARPDWRPKGKKPGSDFELLKTQALDAF